MSLNVIEQGDAGRQREFAEREVRSNGTIAALAAILSALFRRRHRTTHPPSWLRRDLGLPPEDAARSLRGWWDVR